MLTAIRFDAPGTHFDILQTITQVPASDQLETAWLTVKEAETDTDDDALVKLKITTTDAAAGQVVDSDPDDNEGSVLFRLLPAHTEAIGTERRWYDIWVQSTNGKDWQALRGSIRARHSAITQEPV